MTTTINEMTSKNNNNMVQQSQIQIQSLKAPLPFWKNQYEKHKEYFNAYRTEYNKKYKIQNKDRYVCAICNFKSYVIHTCVNHSLPKRHNKKLKQYGDNRQHPILVD